MENPNEIWQVEVKGEVYDTDFGELSNWVLDNSVLETDKVRRGNLRWLEAGKVPMLRDFFNAVEPGTEPPQIIISNGETGEDLEENINQNAEIVQNPNNNHFVENTTFANAESLEKLTENSNFENETQAETDANICTIHPELPSKYSCGICFYSFCKECPTGYGTVKTCPYCGGICEPIKKVEAKKNREVQFERDFAKRFGFEDFGKAIFYPLKFKTSLFFGSLMFTFFSLGQGAASMGSMFLVVAALICFMLANSLIFGVLANTVENFSKGLTDKNFMPRFDDFSIWDDVVHPFFLSVAVWVSSFGLFIALLVGGVWYSWSQIIGEIADSTQNSSAVLPPQSSVQAIDHVKQVTEKLKKQNEGRLNLEVGEDGLTETQRANVNEEAEFQKLNELANNYRKEQLESTLGKTSETQAKEYQEFISKFVKIAGILVLFAGFAFLWGIFYFPAACAVAGYTKSFTATLNPLIGLDTIKHLGVDYIKLVLIYILLLIVSAIISSIFSTILSPFDLPTFGNLPAKFIGSFVTFYISIVFAVTLGFAIYKNSKKLQFFRG